MHKLIAALIASTFTLGAFAQATMPAAAPTAPMAKEMKKEMPMKKAHAMKHHAVKHHGKKKMADKPAA